MAAVGQEFWLVAAKATEAEKDSLLNNLNGQAALKGKCQLVKVPDGASPLAPGGFDTLIQLTDDLTKSDSQLDSLVHRLERQYIELEPNAQFKIKAQRQEMTFDAYMKSWQWDEARYPKSRAIVDNLLFLTKSVGKFDEECRNKTAQYNETKTLRANISRKDGVALLTRDLIDVLTPQVVKQSAQTKATDKFIYTEHLSTVVLILQKGTDQEFLKVYQTKDFCDKCFGKVVPFTAEKFEGLDDKDGNMIWRVVMSKSVVSDFKKACRNSKFAARDFEYSEDAFKALQEQRDSVEQSMKEQLEVVRNLYQFAWSDAMVAWIHVKAMRVFVESVLRFGMPASFAAFLVQPKGSSPVAERKALESVLGGKGATAAGAGDDGEEFFNYVSMSFTPFTIMRA